MKKFLIPLMLVLAFTSLIILINCAPEESVNKKELCGNSVDMKKYGCIGGTCYYVVTPANISFEYVVKATFKAKTGTNPAVEDVTFSYNSTSLSPSKYTSDRGLIFPYILGGPMSSPKSTVVDSDGEWILYSSTFYEEPSFVIELVGECPDESKEISANEVKEGIVTFLPSALVVSFLSAGDDLELTLYSNNPKESINLTITTSLGESETLSLSKSTGTTNIYKKTVPSILSNIKGTDNDGSINVQNGTTVTITYNDALDENNNTVSVTATSTVTGDLAPTCTDGIQNGDETGVDCGGSNCDACFVDGLTFESTTYTITDASYLDYSANGNAYILFTISRYENQVQVFSADIEVVSSTTITSETYSFGNVDYGVTGSVALNNVADYATITGGSVVLVITPLGDYALELDLTTNKGALTGSHTVPGS